MSEQQILAEARGLSLAYGEHRILDKVDLTISSGEILTLVGLNGAGKTTLVKLLLGLLKPDSGSVWHRPGIRIGYSPQQIHRDPTLPMTVRAFLALAAQTSDSRLRQLLAEVGVGKLLNTQMASLSGGELHRVLLARALVRDPELLVLDEPLASVDVAGQSDLYRLIADIRNRRGCGVLLVSHDLYVVMAATDRVICLDGHVCCTGHPESVSRHPEFINLFGRQVSDVLAVYHHQHSHRHSLAGEPLRHKHDSHPGDSHEVTVSWQRTDQDG